MCAMVFTGCIVSSLYAVSSTPKLSKQYIPQRLIRLTHKGISIITKKGPVYVKMLRSNTHGVFVYETDVISTTKVKGDEDHPCAGCEGNHPTSFGRDVCEAIHDSGW